MVEAGHKRHLSSCMFKAGEGGEMIYIHNVTGNVSGPCQYAVLINDDLITLFWHIREDGLAVCLEKAAQAVREKGEGDE